MLFAIHAVDKPGAEPLRLEHYEAHKRYLSDPPVEIVMSGPLVSDDDAHMIGSLFLVEAPSRAAVEEFNANDPFKAAGIWSSVDIHAFRRRQG